MQRKKERKKQTMQSKHNLIEYVKAKTKQELTKQGKIQETKKKKKMKKIHRNIENKTNKKRRYNKTYWKKDRQTNRQSEIVNVRQKGRKKDGGDKEKKKLFERETMKTWKFMSVVLSSQRSNGVYLAEILFHISNLSRIILYSQREIRGVRHFRKHYI